MNDDYLWDKTGPPDPEVARLEELLGELRHRAPVPNIAAVSPARRTRWRSWSAVLAVAASVAVAVGVLWPQHVGSPPGWDLTVVDARSGGARAERLREGDSLVTNRTSRARLRVGLIGELELEPESRLRLLDAGRSAHRLALDRGVMHARIWAPPGRFYVDTPSAVAVDLGCAYTLEVDESGSGRLTVQFGWVGFEHQGRESFVPAGAACLTRAGIGPGTPHFADASAAWRDALATLDFDEDAGARASALRVVLAQARPRDALSLWHLLTRTQDADRGAVYDRLAQLVSPPPGATREGVLAGDGAMLDAWWDRLGFGSAGFWRQWKAGWGYSGMRRAPLRAGP